MRMRWRGEGVDRNSPLQGLKVLNRELGGIRLDNGHDHIVHKPLGNEPTLDLHRVISVVNR